MCDVGGIDGGFPAPPDEPERVAALRSLGLLDLPRTQECVLRTSHGRPFGAMPCEPRFERITALCAVRPPRLGEGASMAFGEADA
jgi:hypothetical protein